MLHKAGTCKVENGIFAISGQILDDNFSNLEIQAVCPQHRILTVVKVAHNHL